MNNDQYKDINKYIEDYYRNTLDEEQKKRFEENIIVDPVFAEKVAFYLSTIIAAKQLRRDETIQRFKEIYYDQKQKTKVVSLRKRYVYIISAVAAILIFVVGYLIFFQATAQELAQQYADSHLSQISETMGKTNDSLQIGISYYNRQKYDSALYILQGFYAHNPNSYRAVEYSGQTYLLLKDYDNAIKQFDILSKMNLEINKGPFYKAITLLERNKNNDKQQAKILLQKIVKENAYGNEEAKALWKKLK